MTSIISRRTNDFTGKGRANLLDIVYAFNTQTCYLDALPTKIRAVSNAGYGAIELGVEEIERHCRDVGWTVADVRKMLADYGLQPFSTTKLDGWFETDGACMGVADDHAAIVAEARRRMDLMAQLGARYIICAPAYSHRGHPTPPMDVGVRHFRELLDLGRKTGVLPTIEFLGQTHQINTVEKCIDFLRLVNDPDARMVVDAYHLWRGDGTVENFAKAPKTMISMLHINDANPNVERSLHRDRDRVMPGDGIIDLKRFFQIARDIGFSGVVSLGVYNRRFWSRDCYEVALEGIEKTKRVVAESLGS